MLRQDLLVSLLLDPWGDLEMYWAQVEEVARMVEEDLAVAEVALRVVRACYNMLVGTWDVLWQYQNNCSRFLDWQVSCHVPEDLGESRDVGLPLDNNDLPLA